MSVNDFVIDGSAESGITFKANRTAEYDMDMILPVPDGYKYVMGGTAGNAGWCYITPESFSPDNDHIDAKPFSFAVTLNPVCPVLPESFLNSPIKVRAGFWKDRFESRGILNSCNDTVVKVVSENCAFIFQSFTSDNPDDDTWNKINGFLLAGLYLFQFHIYANHNENKASNPKTKKWFMSIAEEWMSRVKLKDDSGEIEEDEDEDHFTVEQMSECLGKVCSVIDSTNIVANKKSTISSLKQIIVMAAGIFYNSNDIDFDEEDVSIISEIVGGEIDGKAISNDLIGKAVSDARNWDPDDYFKSFEVRRTVGELVMMDKLAKVDYGSGGTSMYNFIITDFLFALCEKHGIDFESDDCCAEALDALEKTIKNKWDSTMAF